MHSTIDRDNRLDQISNLILEMARGNYDYKQKWSEEDDELSAIAQGIRMLGEELKSSTVSKNYLDSVIKGIVDMLFIVDCSGVIQSTNLSGTSALGHPSNELRGKFLDIFLDPGSKILFHQSISTLNEFGVHANFEMTFISSSGKVIPVACSMSALKRDEQKQIIVIAKDISNQKEIQQRLLMASEAANAASIAKSDFLANMSHEIRTPLNGVIGFTDLLMNTKLDEVQMQYMSTVSKSAHSLLDVINDILDFSKIEAGKLELIKERVDLLTLSHQACDVISFQAQKKNVELVVSLANNIPRSIYADSIRLRQVLVNLMGNAIKFTEEGEIELKVEVNGDQVLNTDHRPPITDHRTQTTTYRFSVRDTGIGISSENQKKIFIAFSQGDSSTTKKYGGTGLGLSISNKLLALMGSSLQLISEPGKGSTFYFDVNFETSISEADVLMSQKTILEMPSKKAEAPVIAKQVPSTDGVIKILVVEDNQINMTLAKIIIKKKVPNATLIEAGNGKLAIEQFTKEKPDIIFMDVQMPEMNGYDAVREIRRIESVAGYWLPVSSFRLSDTGNRKPETQRVPIIALTAGTVKGEKERCFEAGMDDYISKPIVGNAIDDMINKWLSKQN
jgi:PAS domain S-box-containing protein